MEIDLKIGDIVTCTKDFIEPKWITDFGIKPRKMFIKNRDYKITFIDYWDKEDESIVYQIDDIWTFYSRNIPLFNEYFCSKKIMRKNKLNNLENGKL